MGYAGGTTSAPTYHALGDHTEVFQVDFDSAAVSYEELLQMVWESHDPTRAAFKVQYASLVLAHDEQQLAQARASAGRLEQAIGRKLATRIEPLDRFWLAEGYHQKWYLRQHPEHMRIFAEAGYDETAFVNSTYAARLNGALATGQCPIS